MFECVFVCLFSHFCLFAILCDFFYNYVHFFCPFAINSSGLFRDTFERVAKSEGDNEPTVEMSFLEIYNENVYDLLAASDGVCVSISISLH